MDMSMGMGLRSSLPSRKGAGVAQPFPAYWDFANDNYRLNGGPVTLANATTYSRAGSGWADNLAGTWSEFLTGVVRRTDKGVAIEPGSANAIRNDSMQGAVVGGAFPTNWTVTPPTGVTASVLALDTFAGMERIRLQFVGTTSSAAGVVIAFEGTTSVAALTGETWTESLFLSFSNGTNLTSVQINVVERTSGGGFVSQGQSPDLLIASLIGNPVRKSYAYLMAGGGTVAAAQPRLAIGISNGVAVNFVLDLCWPQMEKAGAASTPIRTSGAAVSRAADALTLKAPWDAYDLLFTFSDDTTQSVVQRMGDYAVPTNLSKPTIKKVDATRTDPTKCFDIVGDSIGRGDGGSTFWYGTLATAYSPARPYKNVAVSGQNSTAMRDGALADATHKDWTWIICDGRPNTGEAAATIVQNYKDIITSVTAQGGRVFIAPVLPLSPGGGTDPLAAVVSAVNAALLSDPAFSGKTMGSTPQANYLAALNDDTKRAVDFIHVNDAGQALQATHFKTALDALGY